MLAIDPTSPFTGGAILGDRVRMQDHDTDDGVFIRSMATRGHLGGLSRAAPQAVRVLDAAGYAWVLVGDRRRRPGGGRDRRYRRHDGRGRQRRAGATRPGEQGGLLEIGDVFVVNKADRGGVDATVRDLQGDARCSASTATWSPPIVETVATDGRGVDELVDAIAAPSAPSGVVRGARRSGANCAFADELRAMVLEWVAKQADDHL